MQICSKCRVLYKDVCPICESAKKLIPAEGNEAVLVATLNPTQAMFVEPILQDNGIPYQCPGAMGRAFALRAGTTFETYRIYVPYAAYEKARALLDEVFGEDEAIMRAVHEFDVTNDRGE